MSQGLNSTKTPARPSHEALEETNEETSSATASHLDRVAMEGAKRANNRIHADETVVPGSSEFTH
jgi:hypothetical protein